MTKEIKTFSALKKNCTPWAIIKWEDKNWESFEDMVTWTQSEFICITNDSIISKKHFNKHKSVWWKAYIIIP